jgi:ribonuclease Z
MRLTVLGNGSGGPFLGRHYTAQVLQHAQHWFLIDCGEGTQMQLFRYRIPVDRIRHIFISHLHGDHLFGLPGLLTSYSLKRRKARLDIFAPPGLEAWLEATFQVSGAVLSFPLVVHAVDPQSRTQVLALKSLAVHTIPLRHRGGCTGWLFQETPGLRNLRKDQLLAHQIPVEDIPGIKAGSDWLSPSGALVPNAVLTHPPKTPPSYAFCSDTAPSEGVVDAIRGVSLLYHEATFTEANAADAARSDHSTAAQAAAIAKDAGVGCLLMGHFSSRYKSLDGHLEEARAVFPNVRIAVEGETLEV